MFFVFLLERIILLRLSLLFHCRVLVCNEFLIKLQLEIKRNSSGSFQSNFQFISNYISIRNQRKTKQCEVQKSKKREVQKTKKCEVQKTKV